ncbi:ABC transporter substrate-binding protein [Protaetiibacter larvae]|uniref:Extracellular solute-binding protein n=1 Tax=Protaetiibacter larvae TaxID=2592654 RepID=A0A5C1Y5L2_9MICO|nr:extracellular solute-binding protein [Protaetiibacter larvae]QEO08688.1 extracellular solute-binding protein [Protaetiibacter larvae]
MNRSSRSKVVLSATITASVALALTGCAGGGNDAAASDSINVVTRWASGSPEAEAQQRVLDAFTAETGIKVTLTEGLENIDDQVETAVAAGKSPDLVIVNLYDKTLGWLDAGVTVAADDYVSDWGLDIDASALDEWRVGGASDGALQGLPFSGFNWPIWYNTKLLADAGVDAVPTTTDELIDAAKKLRAAGIAPFVMGGNDWSGQKLFYQIIQSFTKADEAKQVMQEGGYCASDSFVKGIELFTELRDAGVFVDNVAGFTADDMYATYNAGEAAIMSGGSWAFAATVDAGNDVAANTTLGGFPLPDGSVFDAPTAFQGFTGVGFMVTKKGAEAGHIENVEKLVKAFYADGAIGDFVKTANLVTPVAGDFSASATNPLLQSALALGDSVSYAVLPDVWIGSASDPLIQVITQAYGGGDAQTICAGLDKATQG